MALAPTMWIGWEILERGRDQLGQAYAQNFTLLSAQRIEAPVTRELALARRFADSVVLRQWLDDEKSEQKKSLFFDEAAGFELDFGDNNYFIINAQSLAYYLNNSEKPYSQEPRYFLDPDNPDDAWFFKTMAEFDSFNINVNPDVHLGETRIWINVIVWQEGQKIGLAGTGLDLAEFLDEFIAADEPGVTPMILDGQGLIQAHPDQSLISFGSGANTSSKKSYLSDLLTDPADGRELKAAMDRACSSPGLVQTMWAGLNGKEQLLALTWIPELSWHVVSSVDLQAAQVLDGMWILSAIGALVVMLGILLLVFGYGVEKLVLSPLSTLHQSATALASGQYNVSLPAGGRDEIGDLSRAFAGMVEEIKNHTNELETKVRERTSELENQSKLLQQAKESAENAHQSKTQILNKVMESIHYAQTIQQAILTQEMDMAAFVPDCFTVWKPKDVISGDLIWGMPLEDGFAAAVIDCTGHGVPGGLMTMAAFSSLNSIVGRIGMHNPGRVLQEVSRSVQEKLCNQDKSTHAEDGLDMGLCVYQRSSRTLLFSGARLSLFYTDGSELVEIRGDRESLGYRSSDPDFPFQNHILEVNGHLSCYVTTDGIIDQVGDETGLPLGKRRWLAFLNSIRTRPLAEQKQAMLEMYEAFQGQEEQRDDITVLGFRLTA